MGKHVWGYWDCPFCGAKTIRGDHTECPHCGHARGDKIRFYMKNDELEYVPPEENNNEQNWICSFCDNQNAWALTQCAYCGARRDEAQSTYFGDTVTQGEYGQEVVDETPPPPPPPPSPPPVSPPPEPPPNRGFFHGKWKLPVILTCVLMVLLWLFIPITKTLTIDKLSWEREIQIERYTTVEENGWSVPYGGRIKYTRQEVHHMEDVLDHYEKEAYQVYDHDDISYKYKDLGNGQFEEVEVRTPVYRTEYRDKPVYRQQPVMATKYYYEIEKWKYDHSLKSSGEDKSVYWAEVPTLRNDGRAGSERESNHYEHYYINGTFDETSQQYEVSYSKWVTLEEGQTVKVKAFRFSKKALSIEDALE